MRSIEELLNEMIEMQQGKLLEYAQRIVPDITADDLLQPVDFPELENHPLFRYEEGVLHGFLALQMALRSPSLRLITLSEGKGLVYEENPDTIRAGFSSNSTKAS